MSKRILPSDSAEEEEESKKTKTDTDADIANPSPSTSVTTNLFDDTNIAVTPSVASTSSASSEQAGNVSQVSRSVLQQPFAQETEEAAEDNRLIYHLTEVFPEACPQYIRRICAGKTDAEGVLFDLISQVLEHGDDYPRRQRAESPVHHMDSEVQRELVKQIRPDAGQDTLKTQVTGTPIVKTGEPAGGNRLIYHLMEVFPEACPQYIQQICEGNTDAPGVLDDLISQVLERGDYPRRKKAESPVHHMDSEVQLELVKQILPDAGQGTLKTQVTGTPIVKTEEAAGDNPLIYHLMEVFPEACPQYLQQICEGKTDAPGVLDDLISQVLEGDDYPRGQAESPEHHMDREAQLELLKQILPDADPNYLRMHCDLLIDKPEQMREFIDNATETRRYPKLKDYLRKQQISAQQKQYTSDFSVENFLEVIPDPVAYFEDAKRKQYPPTMESKHYAICFLGNHFNRISRSRIYSTFKQNRSNFSLTYKALSKLHPSYFTKRRQPDHPLPDVIEDIPLLQEIAYVQHRADIEDYQYIQKVKEDSERTAAKEAGQLQTCTCCYDEEVMPKDVYTCENGCIFCKECVRRGAEVAFGDGKLDFNCLNNCESHFSLQTLQAVLQPKMFSIVALRKQLEEVKAAGIEDLETCPFCDFATIPAKDDKLFRCLNPDCMKESCRLCKEPSHVPLRCDEVEKDEEVKRRTHIENKMTEALLRTCYTCNKKFIKSNGCNMMTCSCGAQMCYVCGKPVKNYTHFGIRCPLHSNLKKLHRKDVLKGAEEAKREVGADIDPSKLKYDPTADLQQQHHKTSKKDPLP